MEMKKILGLILDTGVALLESGAETHRVEDSLYRLSESYGFRHTNFWVVPSNIQASVMLPGEDEEILTQIRHIRKTGVDFDKLDKLNALSRYACRELPDAIVFREKLDLIRDNRPLRAPVHYLAGILAAGGFALFFNCDALDCLAAVLTSVIITLLTRWLGKKENNPLILNFFVALMAECGIQLMVLAGLGHHPGRITIGVIMLLISGLGTTNGVRDLVHLDTLSGVVNISASFAGATGIALGIALPLVLFKDTGSQSITGLEPEVALQLLFCTIGCVGFAFWFNVKKIKILWCALGACLTWGMYLVFGLFFSGFFIPMVLSAGVCALYGQIMARLNKAPATIFTTVSAFPLIPGSRLYYTMYGLVTQNRPMFMESLQRLMLECFGIVLGFLAVEVISRYLFRKKFLRKH